MAETDSNHLLFVYGTMKRGFRNHSRIIRNGGTFLRAVTSPAIYTMRTKIAGEGYLAPVIYLGGFNRVQGELYSVPEWGFEEIDMAEGHPDVYCRTQRVFGDVSLFVYEHPRMTSMLYRNQPGIVKVGKDEVSFHNISD